MNVNVSKSIEVKGQPGFPQKTKSPSGATTGGTIFSQNLQVRQLRLNLSLRQVQAEREQPSGKDTRDGDSLRLQQDTALLPRLWASGSLVKSKLST
jgi:hypothetical protein